MSQPSAQLITVMEAAQYLTVSTDTIYRMVKQKAIPHIKIGSSIRFTYPALDAWLHAQMAGTPPQPLPPKEREPSPSTSRQRGKTPAQTPKTYPPPERPGYTPVHPIVL